jgi:hypothetical protein
MEDLKNALIDGINKYTQAQANAHKIYTETQASTLYTVYSQIAKA